jgi:hypothetical protein
MIRKSGGKKPEKILRVNERPRLQKMQQYRHIGKQITCRLTTRHVPHEFTPRTCRSTTRHAPHEFTPRTCRSTTRYVPHQFTHVVILEVYLEVYLPRRYNYQEEKIVVTLTGLTQLHLEQGCVQNQIVIGTDNGNRRVSLERFPHFS